jgi:paraquat-inducible protein B
MKRHAAALRVGALALAGLGLIAAAAVFSGGQWFSATERALLRFQTSVFGLQVGAPVVLRGVRVGQVQAVALAPLGAGTVPVVPVTVELERERLQQLLGDTAPGATASGSTSPMPTLVPALVQRGLVARLATQSLLTGQLYVELDVEAPGPGRGALAAVPGALPEVPTRANRFQALEDQLGALDLTQLGRDLASVAASVRQWTAGGEIPRVLAQLGRAADSVQALSARLDRELPPLARDARGTLADARQVLDTVSRQAERVGTQVGTSASAAAGAAAEVQALAASARPLVAELRRSADELSRAAAGLAEVSGPDSALRHEAGRTLADLARAARSLRELGDTLDRHPEVLLRGRGTAP